MSDSVEISIVIRAFNEERRLPRLLEAIRGQTAQDFEVVVVDSGSYDRTPNIVEQSDARLVHLDSRDFTFGYSLNLGVRHSRGDYIAIISAHTEPLTAEWLERLVEPLRNRRTAMVYGRQLGTSESKFSETQDFERIFGPKPRVLRPPSYFANNANSAVRRELWEEHPFDESLPGLEDVEWARYWMERGFQVVYEPAASIYHIHTETWRQVRHRYQREALAAKWLGVKGRADAPLEVVHEGQYLVNDVWVALRKGGLSRRVGEIIRFRWYKTIGTLKGLLDETGIEDRRRRERMFFDRSHQAVVIQGPRQAAFCELELPEIKPGDVLIKVAYVGVCATDLEIYNGSLGYYKTGLAKYPIVPGHEFSGRIVRVGSKVNDLHEGDAVVAECIQSCGRCEACARHNWIGCSSRREVGVIGQDGAYAEFVVVPGGFVHKLPDDTDLRRAALCEPIAVVLKGLRRLNRMVRSQEGIPCAVVGAGPIGHLSAAILSHRGYEVTVFDNDHRRRKCFTQTPIEARSPDEFDRLVDCDLLIEATGDPGALNSVLRRSAPGATVLALGLPYGRREFSFEALVAYDKTVVGSVGSACEDFKAAVELLPDLPLAPFLEKVMPLRAYDQAWNVFRRREYLKILLECNE